MSPLDKNVQDCTLLQFADDIVIYHSDSNPRNILKTLSKEIGKINAILVDSGLEMAPDKFSKIRSTSWEVTINNT
jgi:hypothetical protein